MNASHLSGVQELIAQLNPHLATLAMRGVLQNYKKNSVILNEGELGDSMFVLLQGSVKVYSTDQSGREITYGDIHAGDYFGELSLDGGVRSASVMTMEPSQCSVVSRAAVREHLAAEPTFAFDLVVHIIGRVRAATETARNMALLDVYGRLIASLEGHEGAARPGHPVVLSHVTHQSIASRVGASREMVSRLLKDLEKGGYIELGIKRITLLKKRPSRW